MPGRRFAFGLPRTDNANYLWIPLFYSARQHQGPRRVRHGQLGSDARTSEQELRQKLIGALREARRLSFDRTISARCQKNLLI